MADFTWTKSSTPISLDPGLRLLNMLGRVAVTVVAPLDWLDERKRMRAETQQLAKLDDRMLRDIGVTRGGVEYALLHGGAPEYHRGRPGRAGLHFSIALAAMTTLTANAATAGGVFGCAALPDHSALGNALETAVRTEDSGLDLEMWATLVDRDGRVCAVASSGVDRGAQWPGSRVISAQKANTANAFSLDGLALSTANLFSAVQPGGSLFGLQFSNPVNATVAYEGPPDLFGTDADPMVGDVVGGVNVFGGGLGLYDESGVIGAIGLSGDTSCADHMIAWRVRHLLGLDKLHSIGASGVSGDTDRPDNIIYDISAVGSASGFGHPNCLNTGDQMLLPAVN